MRFGARHTRADAEATAGRVDPRVDTARGRNQR